MRWRMFIFALACFSLWVHLGAPFASNVTRAADSGNQQSANDAPELGVKPPKWVDPGWRILEKKTTVRFDERGGSDATLDFSYKALTGEGARGSSRASSTTTAPTNP